MAEAGDVTLANACFGGGVQFPDPGAARPFRLDVVWRLLCPELPAGLAPMALLEICCWERDLSLSAADPDFAVTPQVREAIALYPSSPSSTNRAYTPSA